MDFFCRCSKENFKSILLGLGKEVVADMKKQGQNELVCNFCNKKHLLDDKDFDGLLE